MEAFVLIIKMLWMLLLTVYSICHFALTFSYEWNVLTLVVLIGYAACQGFSAGLIARGLLIACGEIARSDRSSINEDSDELYFEKLRSKFPPDCTLCGCSFRSIRVSEQQIERSTCKERPHYFHAACFHMWRIDHSICPICREPQQPSSARLIDYISATARLLSNVARATRRVLQLLAGLAEPEEVALRPQQQSAAGLVCAAHRVHLSWPSALERRASGSTRSAADFISCRTYRWGA